MMQETTQVSTAVRPSALGAAADTKLNMLTRTRNRVTSRDIRPQTMVNSLTGRGERGEGDIPGTTSGGTMKDIQETTTNNPVGR